MPPIFNISNLYDGFTFTIITLCNNNTSYNYISLVPSSLLPRSFFYTSSFYLHSIFEIPPLCLRNASASLTKVDRVHYGG